MNRLLFVLAAVTLAIVACEAPADQGLRDVASPSPGNGDMEAVRILDAEVEDAGETLKLTLNTCNPEESKVEVLQESDDSIRLQATARGGEQKADCATGATVELDQPIANRTLIDVTTGEPIKTKS